MADARPSGESTELDGLGWVGHVIAAVMGLLSIIAAFAAWGAGIQPTLGIALILIGVLLPVLTWRSLKRSRAAWAFLISLSIVLGIMTLFGAPKVRDLVGIPIAVALVIPAALFGCVFSLSAQGHRYRA